MTIVVALRLTLSILILKFPLAGGLLAVLIDYLDLELLNKLDPSSLGNYQIFDKLLDLFYLSLEAFIALYWKNKVVSRLTFLLFLYRLIGILIFEITNNSLFLVIFPNLFEFLYLSYLLGLKLFKRDYLSSNKILILSLIILFPLKLTHEYLLHINTTHPWIKNKYIQRVLSPLKLPSSLNF